MGFLAVVGTLDSYSGRNEKTRRPLSAECHHLIGRNRVESESTSVQERRWGWLGRAKFWVHIAVRLLGDCMWRVRGKSKDDTKACGLSYKPIEGETCMVITVGTEKM